MVLCNLRMFLDIVELYKENKKSSSGKTVLKMWSKIVCKIDVVAHEISLKKKCKKVKTHKSQKL